MEMLVLRPTTLIELGSVVLALICELKENEYCVLYQYAY